MSRLDFIQNVRLGASVISPWVQTDHPTLNADQLQRALANADLWLTSRVVDDFNRADFTFLSPADLNRLERAVERFRKIAEDVRDRPATKEEAKEASAALVEILSFIRDAETREIANIVGKLPLPEFVRGFDIELGYDSTDEPAIYLWVVVDDDDPAPDKPGFTEEMYGIRTAVREGLRKHGITRWPYVRLRAISEQGELVGSKVDD